MKRIIEYIKSLFCRHDWEKLREAEYSFGISLRYYYCAVYRCKKCGICKKYKIKMPI